MGFLKNASSMANMIPMVGMTNSIKRAIAASTATAAASQAATSQRSQGQERHRARVPHETLQATPLVLTPPWMQRQPQTERM